MPTFVYMTRCDGCGQCNMCWECYSCVKACPHHAIDVRGYADFAPLGSSVRVHRDEEKGTIAWRIKFRNGKKDMELLAPITTKPKRHHCLAHQVPQRQKRHGTFGAYHH